MSDQSTETSDQVEPAPQKTWKVLKVHHQLLAWENVKWREAATDEKNTGTVTARMENWLGACLDDDITYAQFLTWTEPKYGPYIDEVKRQWNLRAGNFETMANGTKRVPLMQQIGPLKEIILRPPLAMDREAPSSNRDNAFHGQLEALIHLIKSDYAVTMQHVANLPIGDAEVLVSAYVSFR